MSTAPSFHSTWTQFCEDLELTFPELKTALDATKGLGAEDSLKAFRSLWKPRLSSIAVKDASIFGASAEGVEVLPGVRLTASLWSEVSETTHKAIWNYLTTLALLSAAVGDVEDEESFWNEEDFKKSMEAMMRELKDAATGATTGGVGSADFGFGGVAAGLFGDQFSGLFDKLRSMAEGMTGEGGAGTSTGANAGANASTGTGMGGMPNIKIPERLFKGHIAKMARELAEEFKPEDFGISPDMLESQDPTKIFDYLQEIFTKKPDLLMSAAQRIGKKIQAKFMRGEIKRDEIISEIEELMREFSENEAFNALFGNLGDILSSSAKATGNEGSERRRQVQERLRKKAAEKDAKRKVDASAIVSSSAAVAAADAAAAALLAEEAAAGAAADAKRSNKKASR